jgi:hypothetical protein
MSNSWLRLWHDMPTDPKFRTISKVSKQPLCAVIAVYLFMLVDASNASERGRTQANDEDIASAVDLEIEQVELIRKAMQGRVLDEDYLTGWDRRQPKREDNSSERSKTWRESKKKEKEQERNRTQPNAEKRPEEDKDKDKDTEYKDQTTSSSTIHSLAAEFFALFAADGFYIDKVNGNPETVNMVQAWIAAGVTPGEARAVIEQTKAKRGKNPSSPSYYRDIVLDAKRAGIAVVDKSFQEKIKKLFQEILPDYPINVWTEKAAQDLQARIIARYEKFDFKKIKTWRNFFLIVKCSTHIKKHEWHLDYLIREEVFANILNNKRQVNIEQYEKLKQEHANEELN